MPIASTHVPDTVTTFFRQFVIVVSILMAAAMACASAQLPSASTSGLLWPDSYLRRSGEVTIPVLLVQFQGSSAAFTPAELEARLFSDNATKPSLTDYYREVSYGHFLMHGKVFGWFPVSRPHAWYYVDETCNGTCWQANDRIAALIEEAVQKAHAAGVDFSQFDNDGPDEVPNSPDDDGFVDLLVLVYSDRGSGCSDAARGVTAGITPHEQKFWNLTSSEGFLDTGSRGRSGHAIMVNEFVVIAGRNCELSDLNPIGDYAHEIGHALGLPDLVDEDGSSGGIGSWGLMARGGFGGDSYSPELPAHLSAWAKERLGWLTPRTVDSPGSYVLTPVETNPDAIKLQLRDHPTNPYYLLEVRSRTGFDRNLPGPGLLVWRIDQGVVDAWNEDRLANLGGASLNDEDTHKGVVLIEADGRNDLADQTDLAVCTCMALPGCTDRCDVCCGLDGDAGDPFPGSERVSTFDTDPQTRPRSFGRIALCGIEQVNSEVRFTLDGDGICNPP